MCFKTTDCRNEAISVSQAQLLTKSYLLPKKLAGTKAQKISRLPLGQPALQKIVEQSLRGGAFSGTAFFISDSHFSIPVFMKKQDIKAWGTMRLFIAVVFIALLYSVSTLAQVTRLIHPGVLFDRQDLDRMKANYKNVSPFKEGYAALVSDARASESYQMKGPFAEVGREPNLNLRQYEDDAMAAFYQSIQWYLTGNENFAKTATEILNSWAVTQTRFSGGTPRLTAGPTAMYQAAAAEILRYTYPRWTNENTENIIKYFKYVVWPQVGGETENWTVPYLNTANQSALQLRGTLAIAVFCDDAKMFNNAVEAYRYNANGGILYNTLPHGQFGDFGRDMGHAGGQIGDHGLGAEIILKQGIDVWSDLDNRLLSCMEYFCRASMKMAYPEYYVWGPAYDVYAGPNTGDNPRTKNFKVRMDFNLHNAMELYDGAYRKWKGMPTNSIQAYRDSLNKGMGRNIESLIYFKDENYKPLKAVRLPEHSLVYPDQKVTSLSVPEANGAGSAVFNNEAWKVKDSGNSGSTFGTYAQHDLQDGTLVVRVASMDESNPGQFAGIALFSSAHPDSAFISLKIKSGNGGIFFEGREQDGGKISGRKVGAAGIAPYWLKLDRKGNEIIALTSPDGITWAVCSFRFPFCYLPKIAKANLFVNSGKNLLSEAVFDHVGIGSGGKPEITKKLQTIDFDGHYQSGTYSLDKGIPGHIASTSSGLKVTYYSDSPNVVRVENGELKAVGIGEAKVVAYQAGNDEYYPTGRVPYKIIIEQ